MSTLASLIDDCALGMGGVALLRGPSGVGKTALLRASSLYAEEAGVTWVEISAAPSAIKPQGLLAQLAEAAGIASASFAAIVGDLLDRAISVPVALAIDDLDLADPVFLETVSELVRRLCRAGVLIVLGETVRPGQRWRLVNVELLRQPRFCTVPVTRLSRAGADEVLAFCRDQPAPHVPGLVGGNHEQLASPTDDEIGVFAFQRTGGNPLLLRALAEDLRTTGWGQWAEPAVGDAYRQAVRVVLDRGGELLAQVARAAAWRGGPPELRLLGGLVGIAEAEICQCLDVLAEMGLLTSGGFCHPDAQAAVSDLLDEAERRTMHRQAARIRYEEGASPAEVAVHLADADAGTCGWAADFLCAAGEEAEAGDDLAAAVRYFKLAAYHSDDKEKRTRLIIRSAAVGWRLDPVETADDLPDLAQSAVAGVVAQADAVALSGRLIWHGWIDEAAQMLSRLDGGDSSSALEVRSLRLWLEFTCPSLLQSLPEPAKPSAAPLLAVTSAGEAKARAMELFGELLRGGPQVVIADEAVRILEMCTLGHISLEPSRFALQILMYSEGLEVAERWCDVLMRERLAQDDPWWQANLAQMRAHISLLQGDLVGAERHASSALDHRSGMGWGVAVGTPIRIMVSALLGMGRHADAAAQLDRPVRSSIFRTRWGLDFLFARGQYYAATGRNRAALGDFLSVGDMSQQWNIDVPMLIPWRMAAAEVYQTLGKANTAIRLLADQRSKPGGNSRRLRGISARIAAVGGAARERVRTVKASIVDLEASGDQWELARALVALHDGYRDLGESDRADMVARHAIKVAERCGAEPLVAELSRSDFMRKDTDLSDDGETGLRALSNSERRVAELASRGNTNREIARTLNVTVSTVEQHLTRIYRKLKVRRREDLPAA